MGRKLNMEMTIKNPKAGRIAFTCTKYFFLIIVSVIFLFPVYALLINSVMPDEDISLKALWPSYFNFEPYKHFFTNAAYLRYTLNTLFVCFMTVGGVCIGPARPQGRRRLRCW